VVAALVAVGGCANNDSVERLTEYRDRMCGCADRKDAACARQVTEDMTRWAAANPGHGDAGKAAAGEAQLAQQLTECGSHAMANAVTR
jgi:hypothetical protein